MSAAGLDPPRGVAPRSRVFLRVGLHCHRNKQVRGGPAHKGPGHAPAAGSIRCARMSKRVRILAKETVNA